MMKHILAALAASVVLMLSPEAWAQPAFVPHYFDGTRYVPGRIGATGAQQTTEMFPSQLQVETQAEAAIPITTGLKQIGNGWAVAPFGERVVRIRRVMTSGILGSNVYIYLFGSHNDVDYFPVYPITAWKVNLAPTDTTLADTLGVALPAGNNIAGVSEFKLTLPTGDFYPGAYLSIWARRDSSVATVTAATLTLTYEGRWK